MKKNMMKKVLSTKSANIPTPKKLKDSTNTNVCNLLSYTDETIIHILNNQFSDALNAQSITHLENDKINILISHVYLASTDKNKINKNYIDKIVLYMYKVYETTDLENDLLCRILGVISDCFKNGEYTQHEKIFYMAFSYLTKRRKLSNSTRIKAYELILIISKNNIEFIKELFNEFENIEDLKYNNLQFKDYVVIQLMHKIYVSDKNNIQSIENFIDTCMSNNAQRLLTLAKASSDNLYNQECKTFIMFIISRCLLHENGFVDYLPCMPNIIACLQREKDDYFEEYVFKALKCNKNVHLVKMMCTIILNYLRIKGNNKYYALKCLNNTDFSFMNDNERSTTISLLLCLFQDGQNKHKELIIEILDNLKYTKLFYLLENNYNSDGIRLKKKTFLIMLKYINITEKHRDIVLAYINYLKDKEMQDFVNTNFDINNLCNIKVTGNYSLEEVRLKEHEEHYNKIHFIDTFTQYVYFEYNKDFLQNLNLMLNLFIPKNCSVYRINFLKHYAKYKSENFSDIQLDLIGLICNYRNNVYFVSDIYSIFISLLETNSFNLYVKDSLINVSINGLNNIHTMKACGKILQLLNHTPNLNPNNIQLFQAVLGLDSYLEAFDSDLNETNKIIGYLFFVENSKYGQKNNASRIIAIINTLSEKRLDLDYVLCHKIILMHMKAMIKRKIDNTHNSQTYYNILSTKQQYLYDLVLDNNTEYSFLAHKLILHLLNIKLILPHTSITYISFFFTFNYNNYIRDIVKLYTPELINYLEIYLRFVIMYIRDTEAKIMKQNSIIYFYYTYVRSDKLKLKLITKVFKVMEKADPMYTYIILKNISLCNLSRNMKRVVLENVCTHINNLEICFENKDKQGAIDMHMLCKYKKSLKYKHRDEFEVSYEEILYRNVNEELKKLNNKLKRKILQNKKE